MIAEFLAVALAAGAPAPASTFQVNGIGNVSCATWTDDRAAKVAGNQWILGFWSALNLRNDHNKMVGSQTDGEGILGEVRLYCQEHPATLLVDATQVIYSRMDSAR